MYNSFCEFLKYLTDKMSNKNNDIEKFAKCFNNYFRGLNSLVNSAMHSERQFIQATAFNAIIYDIPSKIMAFYVAMIDKMQSLVQSEKDRKYTFLITPSFSNEISVEIISYAQEKPPHDRLLMVSINERSLYNPKGVILCMAHEIAHFVGDSLRERASRKKHIIRSVIYIILSHLMYYIFLVTDDIWNLIDEIEEKLIEDRTFSDCELNYSGDLYSILPNIAEEFIYNDDIKQCIWEYIHNILRVYLKKGVDEYDEKEDKEFIEEGKRGLADYLQYLILWNRHVVRGIEEDSIINKEFSETEIQVLENLICDDIEQELIYINRDREKLLSKGAVSQSGITRFGNGILNKKAVGEYIKPLINVYSETFSDIQMILLTGITCKEYLESFIKDEKMDIEELSYRLDDISRISMVTFAFQLIGQWDVFNLEGELSETSDLQKIWEKIQMQIEILKSTVLYKSKKKIISLCNAISPKSAANSSKIWEETGEPFWSEEFGNISFYINENLLIYLLECIKVSDMHYKEKQQEIGNLQQIVRRVSDFTDVVDVFSIMCGEIESYKKKIFHLADVD